MNKKKTVAIVQSRLGSSRLPLKSLVNLRGLPLIDWVSQRVRRASKLDEVIIAIPDTELDRVLANHLQARGINYIAGSENDVLSRFRKAADACNAGIIVRVCADNPLVSPEAIDELITFYTNHLPDYAYNHIPRNNLWPDGFGAEIVSRELLEQLHLVAAKPSQREHCFNYIWDNADQFNILTFNPADPCLRRPDIKLDIDTLEDYRKIASLNINPDMDMRQIVEICGQPHTENGQ